MVNTALTTTIANTNLRNDLSDTNSSTYRWTDTQISRALDKCVEDYSFISPLLAATQISTIPYSRIYGVPSTTGLLPVTPPLWVERVEYPLGYWPKRFRTFTERLSPQISAPAATTPAFTATAAAGGSLTGVYQYAVTYVVPGSGETTASPIASCTASSSQVTLTNIPTGPYGVTSRNIYRTTSGGSQLKLLTSIADNTTTTYVDTAADGTLGSNVPTSNTTANISQLEIALEPELLPIDTSGIIEIWLAGKHQLDTTGTTIPEGHWDAIYLGSAAYLYEAYLVSTNDNFDFVDGQFRDRVDDSKAPPQWRAQAENYWNRYQARLKEIKLSAAANQVFTTQWGDKPRRWDRL